MKQVLEDNIQNILRRNNIISSVEVVYKFGDLYIAEDTISGAKRNIESRHIIVESASKKILKG